MDGNIICSIVTALATIIVAVITSRNHAETKRGANASEATNRAITCMRKDIKIIKQDLAANNLETSRIDLRQALEHSRDDIPAMLELAQRYFVELHGDADLGPKFLYWVKEKHVMIWAKQHKTDISEIIYCAKHPQK